MPTIKTSPAAMLRAATTTFRQRGYHQSSMADLAAAAGVTKGAFYHHFADKEAVMRGALQALTAFAKTTVFGLATDAGLPLEARVDQLTAATQRLFGKSQGGCFVANTALETAGVGAPFSAELKDFMDAWLDCLTYLATEVGHAEPRKLALRTVADVEGSIVLMQVYGETQLLEDALIRFRQNLFAR